MLGVGFLAAVVGCGPSGPPLGEITGKVTYKNAPLPTGTITFVPQSAELPYGQATITADGTYKANSNEYGDRLPVGQYKVAISAIQGGNPEAPSIPLIPFRYSSDTQSGLQAEVVEGENTIDFELK